MIDTIPNLTIHMMVKNEEAYIAQTLRSVLPFAEKAIIIDTGSTDNTVALIKEALSNNKLGADVVFEQHDIKKDSIEWDGNHLNAELTTLRNYMLSVTETDWVWQVDGDEIYPLESIRELSKIIPMIQGTSYIGLQHLIKWCVNDLEYIQPGPFPKTLRVFPSTGVWQGEFPDEYLWVDNAPVTMNDPRCITAGTVEFLHMSMALHPERRPLVGEVVNLTEKEKKCLSI